MSGFFVGDIDEVLVRNYALTEREVVAPYYSCEPTGVAERSAPGGSSS
ncbi:MAG: hypothetical protein ACKVU1_02925 [bacterium]